MGKFCAGTKARTRPGGPDALPVILHGILHFSRKALLFAPKGGTILLLVPTRFCGRMPRKSAWCGQNGRDETACFDPGGAQRAFGTQNSKSRRVLTAPPGFKSLLLRQETGCRLAACFSLPETHSRDLNSPSARSTSRAGPTLQRRVGKGAGKGPLLLRQETGCRLAVCFSLPETRQQGFEQPVRPVCDRIKKKRGLGVAVFMEDSNYVSRTDFEFIKGK